MGFKALLSETLRSVKLCVPPSCSFEYESLNAVLCRLLKPYFFSPAYLNRSLPINSSSITVFGRFIKHVNVEGGGMRLYLPC